MLKVISIVALMASIVAAPAILVSPASAGGMRCTSQTYYGVTYTNCY